MMLENLPEGLNADKPEDPINDEVLEVRDAQGVKWVTIHAGGVGDPREWRETITHAVLRALGIPMSREEIIARIAADCESMHRDWEQGRATSPDESDYVDTADRALTELDPRYVGSTEEGREFVTDTLYDRQCGYGTQLNTWPEIAEWLVEQLTAE